jgi:hypothetical protein
MTRHAFERDESGAWGASRHETGHACARGSPYAMARTGFASAASTRSCMRATAVLARMLAQTVLA